MSGRCEERKKKPRWLWEFERLCFGRNGWADKSFLHSYRDVAVGLISWKEKCPLLVSEGSPALHHVHTTVHNKKKHTNTHREAGEDNHAGNAIKLPYLLGKCHKQYYKTVERYFNWVIHSFYKLRRTLAVLSFSTKHQQRSLQGEIVSIISLVCTFQTYLLTEGMGN